MTSHHFNIETTGVAAASAYLADTFAKVTAKGKLGLSLAQPDVTPYTLSNEASQ
ncbi:hypothetical protein [Paraburkholderia sp. J67]|uniref:hypothetical protein n=1 Tax=Paraburkholderia sp. J67 TaxID=2805435 RepID=UPI002ABDE5F9|nr:hypothetical protein [Paraburkholderia sp. J67]